MTKPIEQKPLNSEQLLNQSILSILDSVTSKIVQQVNDGLLTLHEGYDYKKALISTRFVLLEVKDTNKKPVLETCTKSSIANSLYEMVCQGLSVQQNQCYFIAYGDKLTLRKSYFGYQAQAKRAGMKILVAQEIYEGDVFSYQYNKDTKRMAVEDHQTFLENRDKEIKGAYAIAIMNDGEELVEIMTINELKQAWLQGQQTNSARDKFTQEFAKKTVSNRLCKRIVNTYIPEIKDSEEDGNHEPTEVLQAPKKVVTIEVTPSKVKEEPQDNLSEIDNPETLF